MCRHLGSQLRSSLCVPQRVTVRFSVSAVCPLGALIGPGIFSPPYLSQGGVIRSLSFCSLSLIQFNIDVDSGGIEPPLVTFQITTLPTKLRVHWDGILCLVLFPFQTAARTSLWSDLDLVTKSLNPPSLKFGAAVAAG